MKFRKSIFKKRLQQIVEDFKIEGLLKDRWKRSNNAKALKFYSSFEAYFAATETFLKHSLSSLSSFFTSIFDDETRMKSVILDSKSLLKVLDSFTHTIVKDFEMIVRNDDKKDVKLKNFFEDFLYPQISRKDIYKVQSSYNIDFFMLKSFKKLHVFKRKYRVSNLFTMYYGFKQDNKKQNISLKANIKEIFNLNKSVRRFVKYFDFSTVRYLKKINLSNHYFKNDFTAYHKVSNIPLIANTFANYQIDAISRSSANLAKAVQDISFGDESYAKSWLMDVIFEKAL